jgi:hypothetical protein
MTQVLHICKQTLEREEGVRYNCVPISNCKVEQRCTRLAPDHTTSVYELAFKRKTRSYFVIPVRIRIVLIIASCETQNGGGGGGTDQCTPNSRTPLGQCTRSTQQGGTWSHEQHTLICLGDACSCKLPTNCFSSCRNNAKLEEVKSGVAAQRTS